MAVLSWGKPTVEFAPVGTTTFTSFPTIKEGTAKLTTTKGNAQEAIGEGGEIVDKRYGKNKYLFECEVFVKKGDKSLFEDVDGVIAGNYILRLTPEDATTEGFIMNNCAVSVTVSWSSADGKLLKYEFDGLKSVNNKILEPYPASTPEQEG